MQGTEKDFRFAIMGAGGIANRFCDAVKLVEGCCVAAVASKSMERAAEFAKRNGVEKYYDSYLEMLKEEKPDCVYIAATTNAHYELSRLCLENGVPVLCEKAMFVNAAQAEELFALSSKKQLFAMEAMWSRFLPAVRQAKKWVAEKAIGAPVCGDIKIGFLAPQDPENRYFSPALGGGAAYDILVYCYEIMTDMLERPAEVLHAKAAFGETGVDVTDSVLLRFPVERTQAERVQTEQVQAERVQTEQVQAERTQAEQVQAERTQAEQVQTDGRTESRVCGEADFLATCTASILTGLEEKLELYGTEGKIVVPRPHFASEAYLYDRTGNCVQHFTDAVTQNGFTYEIEEAMRCIRAGKTESPVVPHSLTLACARMFDQLNVREF